MCKMQQLPSFLCRDPLGALFVLRVHLPGFRTAQSVLRQGHRHLADRLPALWFCLSGGVRCGSGDAQQPEAHRGREGQDRIQGEGGREKPRPQEQHGQWNRRDAASCQHPTRQYPRLGFKPFDPKFKREKPQIHPMEIVTSAAVIDV